MRWASEGEMGQRTCRDGVEVRGEARARRSLEPNQMGVLRRSKLSGNSLLIQSGNFFNDLHSRQRKQ